MPLMITERNIATKRRLEQLTQNASPLAVQILTAFMSWIVQNFAERQLQLIQLSDLGAVVAQITGAPMPRVFAVYVKKQNTATAAYFMTFDDPATAGTTTRKRIELPLLDANKEAIAFYPDGLLAANGLVTLSATAADGVVGSTSGDGPNGFVLIG